MNHKQEAHTLIQGGEWSFYQDLENRWKWCVSYTDTKITSPDTFEKRVEAVEDARRHGYGRAEMKS